MMKHVKTKFVQLKTARFLEATAIGSIILGAGIFTWLVAARMKRPSRLLAGNLVLNTVDVAAVSKSELPFISRNREPDLPANEQLPADVMESLCKLVVTQMVKAFSWDVQIQSCVGKGAWTENQSAESNAVQKSTETLLETPAAVSENTFEEGKAASELDKLSQLKRENKDDLVGKESEMMQRYNAQSSQETLLYQVVLSRDGSFVGFQPLNQAAVSTWAAMPFAQILHRQQKLTPGLWERPLKYEGPPMDAVVLELHVVMDPARPYVFARPSPL